MRLLAVLLGAVAAKRVIGIADSGQIKVLDRFCFTIPDDAHKGQIKSTIVVNKPNQHFLIMNQSQFARAGGDCQKLKAAAKVVEPLVETGGDIISYDLTLAVEQKLSGDTLLAIMVKCDGASDDHVSGQYILDFTNPYGSLETQFSCNSIGLINEFFFFCLILMVLAPGFIYCERTLSRRQVLNEVTALFFAAAGTYCLHVLFFTIHISIYAYDGSGLIIFCFLSELMDAIHTCLLCLVAVLISHGVSVTRADYALDDDEHRRLVLVVFSITVAAIVSAMNHGFHEKDDLNPFGWMRSSGVVTMCLLSTRAGAAWFVYTRGMRTAKFESLSNKREFLVNFSSVYAGWLLSAPLMFALSTEWRNVVFRVELCNVLAYCVLGYYLWPSRHGQVFTCVQPTQTAHPYNEFGLD